MGREWKVTNRSAWRLICIGLIAIFFVHPRMHANAGVTPNFFLVDSLDLDNMHPDDRKLLDSLLPIYHASSNDTVQISLLSTIIENSMGDHWVQYNVLLRKRLESHLLENPDMKADLSFYYKKKLAGTINNVGYVHMMKGEYSFALDYYSQTMKYGEELADSGLIATAANNIGFIYNIEGDIDNAYRHYHRCLLIKESQNDKKGIAIAYNNLAGILVKKDSLREALTYFGKSLMLYKEIGNKVNMSTTLGNLSRYHLELNELDLAKVYGIEELKLGIELGNQRVESHAYRTLAQIFIKNDHYDSALVMLEKSLDIARQMESKVAISSSALLLYQVYEKLNNFPKALEMHVLHKAMDDSLKNQANKKALYKVEVDFQYDKQKAIDDKENEKRVELEKERSERQQVVIAFVLILLLVASVFLIFIIKRLRITRRQNNIIKEQKARLEEAIEELNQTNEEILAQRDQIESQKKTLEQKNREITDNINYASRLQGNLLTSIDLVQSHFKDTLLLYRPRDLVSGDFFWLKEDNQRLYLAVADCTGHGVSGALLTVVCNRLLEETVEQYSHADAGKMLDHVHIEVLKKLQNTNETVDGMDISLCIFDRGKKEVNFAGAHNSGFLVRNGNLIRLEADKRPVGFSFKNYNYKDFSSQKVSLMEGDKIYLHTDGYPDQFGGKDGRKFFLGRFENLILETSQHSFQDQLEIMENTLVDWMQGQDQIDDICILAVQV